MYVLDTDMLSLAQHGHAAVGRRIFGYPPAEVCITVITIEEQLSGWYTELRRNRRPEKLAQIYQRITDAVRFLSQLHIVSFPQEAIARYEALRKFISMWDAWICELQQSHWS